MKEIRQEVKDFLNEVKIVLKRIGDTSLYCCEDMDGNTYSFQFGLWVEYDYMDGTKRMYIPITENKYVKCNETIEEAGWWIFKTTEVKKKYYDIFTEEERDYIAAILKRKLQEERDTQRDNFEKLIESDYNKYYRK